MSTDKCCYCPPRPAEWNCAGFVSESNNSTPFSMCSYTNYTDYQLGAAPFYGVPYTSGSIINPAFPFFAPTHWGVQGSNSGAAMLRPVAGPGKLEGTIWRGSPGNGANSSVFYWELEITGIGIGEVKLTKKYTTKPSNAPWMVDPVWINDRELNKNNTQTSGGQIFMTSNIQLALEKVPEGVENVAVWLAHISPCKTYVSPICPYGGFDGQTCSTPMIGTDNNWVDINIKIEWDAMVPPTPWVEPNPDRGWNTTNLSYNTGGLYDQRRIPDRWTNPLTWYPRSDLPSNAYESMEQTVRCYVNSVTWQMPGANGNAIWVDHSNGPFVYCRFSGNVQGPTKADPPYTSATRAWAMGAQVSFIPSCNTGEVQILPNSFPTYGQYISPKWFQYYVQGPPGADNGILMLFNGGGQTPLDDCGVDPLSIHGTNPTIMGSGFRMFSPATPQYGGRDYMDSLGSYTWSGTIEAGLGVRAYFPPRLRPLYPGDNPGPGYPGEPWGNWYTIPQNYNTNYNYLPDITIPTTQSGTWEMSIVGAGRLY